MKDINKTIAMGVIIAGILMLVSYIMPADGISLGDEANASPSKTAQSSVPSLTASPRSGGGGCGV